MYCMSDKIMQKSLDINFHTEINAHLFYSLPLCIILSDPNLHPWYYENFIDLGMSVNQKTGQIEIDFAGAFVDNWSIYDDILDRTQIRYQFMPRRFDVIDFIIHNINRGVYLVLCFNLYFLPQFTYHYKKISEQLEGLIYGYNKKTKELQVITLDRSKGLVDIKIKFKDFKKAFKWWRTNYLTECKLGFVDHFYEKRLFSQEYPFSLNRFVQKVHSYVNSSLDNQYQFYMNARATQFDLHYIYGMQLYDALISREQDIRTGEVFFTYQMFHALYEHKKAIYTRLNYIGSKYVISEKFQTRVKQYFDVVEKCDSLRLSIIKHNFSKENPYALYDHITNPQLLSIIFPMLNEIKTREKNLLNHILDELITYRSNCSTL